MLNQSHGAGASYNGQNIPGKQTDAATTGGYRYEFVVDPPEYVRCTTCRLPSRDPYLSDCCGNVFCYSCLQEKARSAYQATCPNPRCPSPRAFKTFKNKQVERTVKDLRVFCTNKSKGCTWQDKLSDIALHLARNCQFEDVECTNKCGQSVQRQNFSRHVTNECQNRSTKCQYCRTEGQYSFIIDQHKQTCPKLPLSCPNSCKIPGLLQEDLAAHRKICPLEVIQCEYFSEGCTEKIARQNQARHNKENLEKHLTLTKCELTKARNSEKDVQDIATVKLELGQKLDAIKQDLMIKLDIEMSHVKRELAAVRNEMAKGQPASQTYRHW